MKCLYVYTDASVLENGDCGIGILYLDSGYEKTLKYKYTLKMLSNEFADIHNSNVQDVEMLAIYKSLININGKYDKIVIFSDNKGCVTMLRGNIKQKKKINISKIISNKIIDFVNDNSNNVEYWWVKGHNNIYGNVIVDKIAGEVSRDVNFPYSIPTDLEISILKIQNKINNLKLDYEKFKIQNKRL